MFKFPCLWVMETNGGNPRRISNLSIFCLCSINLRSSTVVPFKNVIETLCLKVYTKNLNLFNCTNCINSKMIVTNLNFLIFDLFHVVFSLVLQMKLAGSGSHITRVIKTRFDSLLCRALRRMLSLVSLNIVI